MRVLALVPGGIDDQVLFFPTLSCIHAAYPKAEIAVVADLSVKEVYQLSTIVHEFIPYSFQASNSPADWANLLGIIRDREFEVVLTPTQSWSMGLLLWLSGVPTRIGYAGGSNDLFLTQTVPLKPGQYLADQYYDLLQALDITEAAPAPSLNLPQADIAWAESVKQQSGGLEAGYVLVYPGITEAVGRQPGQSYPAESWGTILKDFRSRQPQMPLVVLQTSETFAIAAAIAQLVPDVKLLKPQRLGQVAALIAGADLVLSTDSPPLYLAVALKVFALGLFAGNDPARQLPASQGEEDRVIGLQANNGDLAQLTPELVLKRIWSET